MRPPSLAILLLPLLAACAGAQRAPGSAGGTPATSAVMATAGMDLAVVTVQPGMVEVPMASTPIATWRALPQAFLALGLPITSATEPSRLLVSQSSRVRRIADRRLSDFFRCGGSYSDDANAGDATVFVRVQVLPGDDAATSKLRMELRARSGSGTTAAYTVGECGSTGLLERLIGHFVRENAGPAAP